MIMDFVFGTSSFFSWLSSFIKCFQVFDLLKSETKFMSQFDILHDHIRRKFSKIYFSPICVYNFFSMHTHHIYTHTHKIYIISRKQEQASFAINHCYNICKKNSSLKCCKKRFFKIFVITFYTHIAILF